MRDPTLLKTIRCRFGKRKGGDPRTVSIKRSFRGYSTQGIYSRGDIRMSVVLSALRYFPIPRIRSEYCIELRSRKKKTKKKEGGRWRGRGCVGRVVLCPRNLGHLVSRITGIGVKNERPGSN